MSGESKEGGGGRVLLAGFPSADAERLADLLDGLDVTHSRDPSDVADAEAGSSFDAVVTGTGLDAAAAEALIRTVTPGGGVPPVALVLGAGADLAPLESLLLADRLFFVAPTPPELSAVAPLVRSAVARPREPVDAQAAGEILALERDLSTASRRSRVAEALVTALPRLLPDADDVRCLIYDRATESLVEPLRDAATVRHSAAAGLLAWVARTGQPVEADEPGRDPRHDADLDGPGDSGLTARPLTGADGTVLGVVALRRSTPLPPMGERRLTAALGRAAAALDRLGLAGRFAESTRGTTMFRPAALEAQARGSDEEGALLELGPDWVRRTYRVLLLLLAVAVVYVTLATRTEYVSGPAVIEVDGRAEMRAPFGGTVVQVEVAEGDRVAVGAPLVRFYGAAELAEVESLERQLTAAMVERLRSGDDRSVGGALADLRGRWQRARAGLEQRTLRATKAGEVRELRVERQQAVASGDVLVVLGRPAGSPRVLAFLPGSARPQLEEGMEVRLRLDGYPQVVGEARLVRLSDSVIGPREADRLLPGDLVGALDLQGAVLPVEAQLADLTFESGGERYEIHGGMTGTLEAAVRRERLLFALVPGLDSFGGSGGGR